METSRPWSVAGLVAGVVGLATSYLAAVALSVRASPVVAVAELVVRLTPGDVAERAVQTLGSAGKPLLLTGVLVVLAVLLAAVGRLARRGWGRAVALLTALAGLAAVAVLVQRQPHPVDLVPVLVGLATWVVALRVLTTPLRAATESAEDTHHSRRAFLLRAGLTAGVAVVAGGAGRLVGRGRRHVEETRRLLKIPGVTRPVLPPGVRVGLDGVTPWLTPLEDFYLVHTAIVVPAIEPAEWSLRIHGLVDREVVLSYADLVGRRLTEAWVTLACVSNEVGGSLVGNAWWSGVRLADLLADAGVQAGADAVLQTSEDGWTCATPLEALTDDRNAMLAVAMNGRPLPLEHGFPVRTVVPGLYGFVSATKWVVDLEVTRFEDVTAFWTQRGWSEQAPVKLASRIDVPRAGSRLPAGEVRVGGVAWAQRTGVEAVEVSVDDGEWLPAELARVPNVDTWVQWAATLDLEPGDHLLRVRATDRDGEVQTGVRAEPVPDGATGWHEVDVTVEEE